MFSVAFCGIVYRGIMVTIIDRSMSGETESHFFYDLPSLEKYLKPHGFEFKTKPKMGFEKKWWKQNTNRYTKLSYRDAIEKFFEDAVSDQHRDFFIERKLPVVACHPTIYDDRWSSNPVHDALLVVNPLLSHWEFYKVMDAYTAFQELEMFLGGVMAGEDNPMAGISDEDLAKAKGYDCYSFKKPPTKRLPKGCK